MKDASSLEGEQEEVTMPVPTLSTTFHSTTRKQALHLGCDLTNVKKFPLNCATRRNLAKSISWVYHTVTNPTDLRAPLVELHKCMARPLDALS